MNFKYFLIFTVSFLFGCSPISKLKDNLNNVAPCCLSYKDINYEKYPSGDEVKIEINENSPAFNFKSGISYFSAFNISAIKKKELKIKINALGSTRFSERAFCPMTKYLDADFNEIESDPLNIKWVHPGAITWGHWLANQKIPEASKYIIIYTSSKLLNTQLATSSDVETVPVVTGDGMLFIPVSGGGIPCSPTGKITIIGN